MEKYLKNKNARRNREEEAVKGLGLELLGALGLWHWVLVLHFCVWKNM